MDTYDPPRKLAESLVFHATKLRGEGEASRAASYWGEVRTQDQIHRGDGK